MYTILSMETPEKYLAHMNKKQVICRFELDEFHFILIGCVLKLFKGIKYMVLIRNNVCHSLKSVEKYLYWDVRE